jgi:hypothetical protein
MTIFKFEEPDLLGYVIEVDTRKILVNVETKKLSLAKLGSLVVAKVPGGTTEKWLIALVDKITKSLGEPEDMEIITGDDIIDRETNTVQVVLIGTVKAMGGAKANYFSRSILDFPDIDSKCYVLQDKNMLLMWAITHWIRGQRLSWTVINCFNGTLRCWAAPVPGNPGLWPPSWNGPGNFPLPISLYLTFTESIKA